MGLFGTSKVKEASVNDCKKMMEGFFKKLGLDPRDHRVDDGETIGWSVSRGSALIYIMLNERNGLSTIRFVSPILFLPKKISYHFIERVWR